MIDYYLYNYNRHQLDLVKSSAKIGVMLNIALATGLEEVSRRLHPQPLS